MEKKKEWEGYKNMQLWENLKEITRKEVQLTKNDNVNSRTKLEELEETEEWEGCENKQLGTTLKEIWIK